MKVQIQQHLKATTLLVGQQVWQALSTAVPRAVFHSHLLHTTTDSDCLSACTYGSLPINMRVHDVTHW